MQKDGKVFVKDMIPINTYKKDIVVHVKNVVRENIRGDYEKQDIIDLAHC